MKKIKIGLLPKVLFAILAGAVFSQFLPLPWVRFFETINALFSEYLTFMIPLIILGLIVPGIAELGKTAGKVLLATALIAWCSTVLSGFVAYGTSMVVYPHILLPGQLATVGDAAQKVTPYFAIEAPPFLTVTSALLFAFILGLTLSSLRAKGMESLYKGANEFKEVIMMVIQKTIIPILPLYIFGIFLKLGAEGQVAVVLTLFAKVIVVIFILHILWLLFQFALAGGIARQNPWRALLKMLPAYATALGTQSSAATIPVTLQSVINNGVKSELAAFVVPLCATIHLSGSILKVVACAVAISWLTNMPVDLGLYAAFIFPLSITVVAAPGIPGGVIMASLGLLASILGYNETQTGLMIALYIGMDSFGTACNVTGDGAIAMVVNRWFGKSNE